MASRIFDLPIAAVSMTDSDRQWFKSRVGVDHARIPRDRAPFAETCDVLVIEDFQTDPSYRDSVLGRSAVGFYAGAPSPRGTASASAPYPFSVRSPARPSGPRSRLSETTPPW